MAAARKRRKTATDRDTLDIWVDAGKRAVLATVLEATRKFFDPQAVKKRQSVSIKEAFANWGEAIEEALQDSSDIATSNPDVVALCIEECLANAAQGNDLFDQIFAAS